LRNLFEAEIDDPRAGRFTISVGITPPKKHFDPVARLGCGENDADGILIIAIGSSPAESSAI
jgi:hypothetical protein